MTYIQLRLFAEDTLRAALERIELEEAQRGMEVDEVPEIQIQATDQQKTSG